MTPVDERRLKLLLVAALVLVGAGVWAFLLRGADGPQDPTLGDPLAGASPVSLPGDPERVLLEGFEELAVSVDPGDGSLLAWCLLAALNAEQRARGLMEVTDLQGYSGMAFVYEDDVQNPFYMRNTPTPLSIVWIAADGRWSTSPTWSPARTATAARPTRRPVRTATPSRCPGAGCAALGITESSRVIVGGSCAPR